jgi:hypothetical protein
MEYVLTRSEKFEPVEAQMNASACGSVRTSESICIKTRSMTAPFDWFQCVFWRWTSSFLKPTAGDDDYLRGAASINHQVVLRANFKMYSRSARGGEKGDPKRNPWLAKMPFRLP